MALIMDFEASGLDTATSVIYEIGAMLVTDDFKPRDLQFSQLVWEEGYPSPSPRVVELTGLTEDKLRAEGVPLQIAFAKLDTVMGQQETTNIVAYNKEYDENLFKAAAARCDLGRLPILSKLLAHPWLCAMNDIEHTVGTCRKLAHLAIDYGIAVNPAELHRAIQDVELTRKVLVAAKATTWAMHQYQQLPWTYLQGVCVGPWVDGGKSRDLVKSKGYRWQSCGDEKSFKGQWVKKVKDPEAEKLNMPFPVMEAEEKKV